MARAYNLWLHPRVPRAFPRTDGGIGPPRGANRARSKRDRGRSRDEPRSLARPSILFAEGQEFWPRGIRSDVEDAGAHRSVSAPRTAGTASGSARGPREEEATGSSRVRRGEARCTRDALTSTVASSAAERTSGSPTHGASLSRARPCRAIAFVLFPHRRHPPPLPPPASSTIGDPFHRLGPPREPLSFFLSLRRGMGRSRTPNLMGETQGIEVAGSFRRKYHVGRTDRHPREGGRERGGGPTPERDG